MESVQQQSFPISEARLISSASRPLHKSNPKTLLILAIAGLGGMALGFGIGLLRDLSDRVFRTSEQVSSLLQADCIARVPLWTSKEASHASDNQSASPGWNDSETILPDQNKSRAIANSLFSKLAEAFRSFTLVSDMRGTIKSTKLNVTSFATSLSAERGPAIDSLKSPKTFSQL